MDVTIMRSFNKLANLHSVFFKKAGPGPGGPEIPPSSYYNKKGPLTLPFDTPAIPRNSLFNEDQVRRQYGIATAAGGAGKMLSHVASKGISGIPGGMAAAIPNVMAAGSLFKKDIPSISKAVPELIQNYAGRNNPKVNYGKPDEFNDVKDVRPGKY
jgi:hypothetical protein